MLVQVLPGFSSSRETEVICLPVELACSEQQLPRLSFSNLPARGEVPVPSVPRPAPGQGEHRSCPRLPGIARRQHVQNGAGGVRAVVLQV